jgi:hypothetical protein
MKIATERERPTCKLTTIGFDLAKNAFQVHGIAESGALILVSTVNSLMWTREGRPELETFRQDSLVSFEQRHPICLGLAKNPDLTIPVPPQSRFVP